MTESPRWTVKRLFHTGYRVFVLVSTLLLVFTLLVALPQIFSRFLSGDLSMRLLWTSTISRYLFIATVFFAVAVAETENEHIKVEVLRNRVARGEDGLYDCVIELAVTVTSGILATSAAVQARNFWGTASADLLWFRSGWLYLPVLIGFGIVFLYRTAKTLAYLGGRLRDRQIVTSVDANERSNREK